MWLVDLDYKFECDWLIELSDNKLSDNKLSNNKLFNNNLASELVENRARETFVWLADILPWYSDSYLARGAKLLKTKMASKRVISSLTLLRRLF